MPKLRGIAELHPAYLWDCDSCGEENFCRRMVTGDGYILVPDIIECWNCKCVYKTDLPDLEEEEDNEGEEWRG